MAPQICSSEYSEGLRTSSITAVVSLFTAFSYSSTGKTVIPSSAWQLIQSPNVAKKAVILFFIVAFYSRNFMQR